MDEYKTAWQGPMLLGLLGLLFSIVVALFVDRAETERADAAFLQMSDRLVQATQSRLSNYAVSLRYAHAFLGANRNNTIEFSRYIQFLNLPAALPGALSIGLIRKVSAEDWDKYYAQSQQYLPITQYKVQSLTDAFIVEALEPGILKTEVLGYDFAQDPELAKRLAAAMAHEQELIIRSAAICAQHHADFFVFVPWYSLDSRFSNISSKGRTVLGLFYMPIDAEKMMASISNEYSNFLNFSIYFGNEKKEENKIFSLDKNNKQSLDYSSFGRDFLINYAGTNFTFMIKSSHDFDMVYKKNDYAWCLLFGTLISTFFAVCYGLLKNNKKLKDDFYYFSQSKKNNNDKYECVLDAVGDVIFTIDYNGKVLKINKQAEMVFKFNESDVVGKNLAPFLLDLSLPELNNYIQRCINMQDSKLDSTLINLIMSLAQLIAHAGKA
jgi:CHASE1-domain containing sensor protein